MRSIRAGAAEVAGLWDEPVLQPVADGDGERHRSRRSRQSVAVVPDTVTVSGVEFASRGWGPGTVLHFEPARRAERGTMVVVADGDVLRVGEFVLATGRPALRTDLGVSWLGARAAVVGVVRMVEAPLEGTVTG